MMAPIPKPTKMGTNWWERVVVQRSACAVDAQVETLTERSPFLLDQSRFSWSRQSLAMLYREEVATGGLLGAGTYSNVYEVTGLDLLDEDNVDTAERGGELLKKDVRESLSKSVFSKDGETRYAIKHLKADLLKDTKTFEAAACDLIMEAQFLSRLSHPNILPLRGMAFGGTETFSCTGLYDSFFIVVDRIHETLNDRLRRWRIEHASGMSSNDSSVLDKIKIALQVADALGYCHERRLVFRDLKPHNIGLNSNSKVQLFDFGFCRELPRETEMSNTADQTREWDPYSAHVEARSEEECGREGEERLYGMSGKGTLMYMSPEVLGTRRYNLKTDTYGWATIFYEMLTLNRPYNITSVEAHRQAIYKRKERPPLQNSGIPQPLQNLLRNCWDGDITNRFSIFEAKAHLDFIYSDYSPGLMTMESFHECLSSTTMLLSPLHDMLASMVIDMRIRYENIFPGPPPQPKAPPPPPQGTSSPPTIDPGTIIGTTHAVNGGSSLASSLSGMSFAEDSDDNGEKRDAAEESKVDDVKAEDANQKEKLVTFNEGGAPNKSSGAIDKKETLEGKLKGTKDLDSCQSTRSETEEELSGPSDEDRGTDELQTLEEVLTVDLTTDGDHEARDMVSRNNFDSSSRRLRRAPRSQRGTLNYHRYYGHLSLDLTKYDDSHDSVSQERFLRSNYCTARAA